MHAILVLLLDIVGIYEISIHMAAAACWFGLLPLLGIALRSCGIHCHRVPAQLWYTLSWQKAAALAEKKAEEAY